MRASRPLCRNSSRRATIPCGPTNNPCRNVPTQNDILVPETLLKKRKSQEKERAEKAEQREARKKVGLTHCTCPAFGDDIYQP